MWSRDSHHSSFNLSIRSSSVTSSLSFSLILFYHKVSSIVTPFWITHRFWHISTPGYYWICLRYFFYSNTPKLSHYEIILWRTNNILTRKWTNSSQLHINQQQSQLAPQTQTNRKHNINSHKYLHCINHNHTNAHIGNTNILINTIGQMRHYNDIAMKCQ